MASLLYASLTFISKPLHLKHIRHFSKWASSERLIRSAEPNVLKVQAISVWPTASQFFTSKNISVINKLRSLLKIRVPVRQNVLCSKLLLTRLDKLLNIFWTKMDSPKKEGSKDFSPPITVRGMKVLDRSVFTRDIKVFGLPVPVHNATVVTKRFKTRLLKIPKIRSIAELNDLDPNHGTHKLFLFDPHQILSIDSISEVDVKFLSSLGVDANSGKLFDIMLAYENWTYDEILDAVLPENTQGVGGFSVIGHIAHLNLKEDLLDYKQIIGDVLLDKINAVKTVVNKINIIDNTYRNFQMELLAGEDNFITVAKEHGLSFEFDFSKVYWNSRLGTEHQRIVERLSKVDVLYDVFAGVGPFAIPAAKKGCSVVANDLNPESYRWLQHNVKLNKVKAEINLHNLDGREFIRTIVKSDLVKRWTSFSSAVDVSKTSEIHVVMNLPAIAIEFLDAFRGLFHEAELRLKGLNPDNIALPIVHCYCFSKNADVIADARQRTEDALGVALTSPNYCAVRIVRNVAPNKEMLCVSFQLPRCVLVADGDSGLSVDRSDAVEEPKEKKARTS